MDKRNNFFETYKNKLNKTLMSTVTHFIKGKSKNSEKLNELLQYFIQANKKGKLFRGISVCLGYKITGAPNVERSIIPAVAYEIFQTAILIHDDIIDKSLTRRGIDSVKFKYSKIGQNKFGLKSERSSHYGLSHSICMGDIGLFLAPKLVLESDFNDKIRNKATKSIVETIITTGLGQMLDIELPYYSNKTEITEDDITSVNLNKTAQYTCTGPLQLGAILGDADEELLSKLKYFGDVIGSGFQIKDDLLLFASNSNSKGTGDKDYFADFTEGKKTLLLHYALGSQTINKKEKNELIAFCGKSCLTQNNRRRILYLLEKSCARRICEIKILKLKTKAKRFIKKITTNEEHASLLRTYIDKLLPIENIT